MITDRHGRAFRRLRVSLTAACNYACIYCVKDGKRLLPAKRELGADRLLQATRLVVAAADIDRLRITGGEPLVSKEFETFAAGVRELGLSEVTMTTNGQLLRAKRDAILAAGIDRINVSLDTLHPLRFRQIARGGDLHAVLDGIDCMLEAGIGVKVNMVPMRNINAGEVLTMLDYCLARGIELRYIELMNMGHLAGSPMYRREFFSMEELLAIIARKYACSRTDAPCDSTAARFSVPGKGAFGIVANASEPFCANCTRLRLSSDGYLYGCLSNTRRHAVSDLLDLPRDEAQKAITQRLEAALRDKRSTFRGETTVMKFIGG